MAQQPRHGEGAAARRRRDRPASPASGRRCARSPTGKCVRSAVAEERAARIEARRIDRQHGDAHGRARSRAAASASAPDERRLARARRAGEADDPRPAAGVAASVAQMAEERRARARPASSLLLDERDEARQRRASRARRRARAAAASAASSGRRGRRPAQALAAWAACFAGGAPMTSRMRSITAIRSKSLGVKTVADAERAERRHVVVGHDAAQHHGDVVARRPARASSSSTMRRHLECEPDRTESPSTLGVLLDRRLHDLGTASGGCRRR